jgi:hypothetical protein
MCLRGPSGELTVVEEGEYGWWYALTHARLRPGAPDTFSVQGHMFVGVYLQRLREWLDGFEDVYSDWKV